MASLQTLVSFNNASGFNPAGDLYADAQGNLYGTTSLGGGRAGTVFEIARTGTDASGAATYATSSTTLVSFTGRSVVSNGGNPQGSLIADAQGNLYGTTYSGGANDAGTVFEIARTGTNAGGAPTYAASPTTLVSFTGSGGGTNGGNPNGSLIADTRGNLYGTTSTGGANGAGTVFEIARTGTDAAGAPTYASAPATLVSFGGAGRGTNGGNPNGSLIADAQGNLYGTTSAGGVSGAGTVFEIARTGTDAAGAPTYAASPITLASLTNSTGRQPNGSLIADAQGNLYGTASFGGATGDGTVFRVARTGTDAAGAPTYAGTPTVLISFAGSDGTVPNGSLIADSLGNLYGTTQAGGTDGNGTAFRITDSGFVTCFATGTAIRTARGEVAVEDLAVGDIAVTASGSVRPIVWIGHRALDGRGRGLAHDQQPVRIRAGAFGPGIPARDLRLSPGHPVLVGADPDCGGGVLVPVMCLINGTTITREAMESITYWHVELDAHDILLAEGLPAESYLDWGDRPFFAEGSDHALHNPDFVVPGLSARCRPVATDGAVVDAERERLDARFAMELAGHSAWADAAVDWLTA